jgi:hypothetical protein
LSQICRRFLVSAGPARLYGARRARRIKRMARRWTLNFRVSP